MCPPWCFAHPKCRAFWLGGVSGDGQLSEGRRAGSVGDGVGEGTRTHRAQPLGGHVMYRMVDCIFATVS